MPNRAKGSVAKTEQSSDIAKAVQQDSRRRRLAIANRLLPKTAAILAAVGLMDFAFFLIGASYFGGDALNGKIDGGRYYLYGPYHGTKAYHEVSQAVFDYSRWHAYSLIILWPLMIVLIVVAERAANRVDS